MINKRGQALVEFIIILPVFIFIILTIIDIGNLLYDKNSMQQELNKIVSLYEKDYSYKELLSHVKKVDDKLKLELKNENNEYIEIYLTKKPTITTPGLNLIINKDISVKRVVYYD